MNTRTNSNRGEERGWTGGGGGVLDGSAAVH